MAESKQHRIVIVEDEALFGELLSRALQGVEGFAVEGVFDNGEEAAAQIPSLRPDVAVLDIELGVGARNGIELGLELRRQVAGMGIVLLSNHRVPDLFSAIPRHEVSGFSYLLKQSAKDLDMVCRAIRGASEGLVVLDDAVITTMSAEAGSALAGLTPRQVQILELMAKGLTNQGIAEQLALTTKSIENQVNLIYRQMEIDRGDRSVQPRVQAVLKYIEETASG